MHSVCVPSKAHEDIMVEASGSRGAHKIEKIWLTNQTKCFYATRSRENLWSGVKNYCFIFFELSAVNSHILHHKASNQKVKLDQFLKKVAGWLSDVWTAVTKQASESPAVIPVGRGHFARRIPATEFRAQGRAQRRCVQAEENITLERQ